MWVQQNVARERAIARCKEIKEESARMTDSNQKDAKARAKTKAVLLIGLKQRDHDNLAAIAARYPDVKNYGVLVRRLLAREAKRLTG